MNNNGKEASKSTFEFDISIYRAEHKLKETLREAALSRAPTKNPCRFKDQSLRFFSNLWFLKRKTSTPAQKDAVGMAYIAFALGLGQEVAEKFRNKDIEAYELVKKTQSNPPEDIDLRIFWEEIQKIFPGIYSDIDISFLSNFSIEMADHLLMQIDIPYAEDSPVVDALKVSLHQFE